jgi:hypothetical protein
MTTNRAARLVMIFSLFVLGLILPRAESQSPLSFNWSSAGQMTQARSGAAAVLLSNGSVLITGGTDSSGIPLAATEIYNPATGAFTAAPAMNVPRANHAAIVLKTGDVLVTGGLTTGGGYSDSAETYSVSSQQWTVLQSSIGTGLAYHAMAQLADGNVLIAGGTSTTKVVGSIVLYNLTNKTFTPIATMLTPRTNAVAAATPDGRVLIAGGTDINGAVLASTEIVVYNTSTLTGTVSAGPTMTSPRVGATATTTYDGVAVIGGNNGQNDLGTAEIFSQWTNTFKAVSGGTPRSQHFAALLPNNGGILVMGGTGGAAVDLLQPWANKKAGAFIATSAAPVNQNGGFGSPSSLGSLLAGGGMGNFASAAEVYLFPTVSTDKSDYAPGTPVKMTGTGFQPFETVDLHLHEWVNQSTEDDPDASVTADALGNFSYSGYAPNTKDLGARYHLTAVGLSSGYQAQTIFTDGITFISITSPPLDQSTTTCGAITLQVYQTGGSYGTIYLYDNNGGTSTGTFYSDSGCTSAITTIPGQSTVNLWYKNATAGTYTLYADASSEAPLLYCTILGGDICGTGPAFIYGAPSQLSFSTQPNGGAPGAVWTQQPVVLVQDSHGSTVTGGTGGSAPITLAISTNPGGGTLSCTSNPLSASSGVASFSGCSINAAAGTCYYLTASTTVSGVSNATSGCFYISTAADPGQSKVSASPTPVSDTGVVQNPCTTSCSVVTVILKDSAGNAVAGKAVTLTQGTGSSTIGAASGVSGSNGTPGSVTFTVTDTKAETVTYTATDTTDGKTVTQTTQVQFTLGAVNPNRSTVTAAPTAVPDDGATASTITVTLLDGTSNPVPTKTVTLTATGCSPTANCTAHPGVGSSAITTLIGTTNSLGQATFTVTDTVAQTVTYTAKDTTDTVTVSQTAPVTFTATTSCTATNLCAPTFVWTPTPTSPQQDFATFPVTASAASSVPPDTVTPTYNATGGCSIAGTTVTMNSGTQACVVTAHIVASGSPNYYAADTISATVNATPATVTATAGSLTGTYTGLAQTPGACTVSPVWTGGPTCTDSPTSVGPPVGSGTVTPVVSGGGANFTVTPANGSWSIGKASTTTTITCNPTTVVYNGGPWAPCTASVTGVNGLNQGLTVVYTPSNVVAGTVTATATYAGDSNDTGSSASTTFTITQAVASVTLSNTAQQYTGSPLQVGVSTTPPGLATTVTYNGSTTVPSAVGVYPVVATIVDPNFVGSASGNFTIYTGVAQLSLGLRSGETNNGPYGSMLNFDLTLDATSCAAGGTVQFYVTPPGGSVTAMGPLQSLPSTPPGNSCIVTLSTATLIPGSNAIYAVYSGAGSVGGGTSNTVTQQVNEVGTQVTLSGPLSINAGAQATFTATVTTPGVSIDPTAQDPAGTVTFYVDGTQASSLVSLVCTGSGSSLSCTAAFSTSSLSATAPGSPHLITATYTPPASSDPDFAGSSTALPVDVTVNLITPTINWGTGGTLPSIVYGTALTAAAQLNATATDTTVIPNIPVTGTYTYSSPVGTVLGFGTQNLSVTFTPSDPAIYNSASDEVTITVTAATPTLTLTCPEVPYDGNSHGCTFTAIGVDGVTPVAGTPTITPGNETDFGSYPESVTFVSADPDYQNGTATATLKIDVAQVTATAGGYTGVYDGLSHATAPLCAVTGTGYTGGVTCTNSYVTVGPGVTTGPPVTVTPVVSGATTDFAVTLVNSTYQITPAQLTVTGNSFSQPYGQAIPALGYTITGFVNNETSAVVSGTATCTTTATPTSPVGTYPINCATGSTLSSSNYSFQYVAGTLTVTATAPTLSLTCTEVPYDGNLHSCVGTALGVDGKTTVAGTWVYSPPSETNAGSYPTTGTFSSGDTNYQGGSTGPVTLIIDKVIATVTAGSLNSFYNTFPQSPSPCTVAGTGFTGTLTCTNNPASVGPGVGGPTAVVPVVSGGSNYTYTTVNGTWQIKPTTVTPQISNLFQIYTGSPLPVGVTTNPLVASVTVTYTGTLGTTYTTSTTPPSAVGYYTVTATVVDPNYIGSATGTLDIIPYSATLTLSVGSGNTTTYSYGTMIYLYLSGLSETPCPTGNVQYYLGPQGGTANPQPLITLNGSSCTSPVTFSTATLVPGAYQAYAVYGGDSNYSGKTSNTVDFTVTADGTAVNLAAQNTTVNVGLPFVLTATVVPSSPPDTTDGATGPIGTVTFYDNGSNVLGTSPVSLTSNGYQAVLTTANLPAGSYNISATYTSTDGEYTGSSSTVVFTVAVDKIAPTIAWAQPANIVYGTALTQTPTAGAQLNATATDTTVVPNIPVAGTFTYTPVAGTVLAVGTTNLSVNFAPTDTATYLTPASPAATVTITVLQAAPSLSLSCPATLYNSTPQQTCVGTALGVDGVTKVSGLWTFSPTTETDANSYTITGTFASSDPNYKGGTAQGTMKINPAVVTITAGSYNAPYDTLTHAPSACVVSGTGYTAGLTCSNTPTSFGPGVGTGNVTPNPTAIVGTLTDYAITPANGTWTISKATPTVTTLPIPTALTFGQPLSLSTLNGGAASLGATNVPGGFAWTTPGTVPPLGTSLQSVTFTPGDTGDYNNVIFNVTVTVNKATPTVTLPTAGPLTYGQTLASSALTGGSHSVAGSFGWTTPGTIPPVGSDSESVTFTPTNTTDYNSVIVFVTVTVSKATPVVTTLPTASPLTYGQALSLSTLTGGAASVGATNVAGTFAWTAPGTVPPVGSDSESVTFTPSLPGDYNPVTISVTVTVGKATPTVTTLPTPSALTFGQALSSSTLTGGVGSVPGGFAWTTPGTVPPLGTSSQSVTFTPNNTTDYNTVTVNVTVTVGKATPTVSVWPTASAIYIGQTLASSTLTGGTPSVPGTFTWTSPTTAPPLGATAESVTFTPNDATDYNTVTGTVTVTVNAKVTPTVTVLPTPTAITYGQTLASSTLNGGTASVAGAFTWTTPTTAPGAGTPTESVTFTPSNTTEYNTVTATVTITVNKATPTVSLWPTASAIYIGQTLASSTLTGGTPSVPGTFTWTSPTTAPPLGATAEGVTFTPNDAADYNTVTGTVTVTVNAKVTPTVTVLPTPTAITYGQTLASSTLNGGTASVAGAFTWTTPTTAPGAGTPTESVTFTPSNTTDYNTVTGTVTITVNKATPTVSVWPTAGAITTGQALSSSTLTGGTASVAGTFTWSAPATVPPLGSTAESVTFTPNDAADYNTVTGTVTVTVNGKTTPTVSAWPTASALTYGQTLSSSTLNGGTASVAGSFSWTTPTTAPGAGTPTESVTFTPNDTADYNTVAGTVTVTVSKATPTVSAWPTAGALTSGQALSSSALTGGTASVPGGFAWTTPTTVPPVGSTAEGVTFTPNDAADYNTVTGTVSVTVSKATPTVSAWPTAGTLTYGQTLSSSNLAGGTASVAGSFTWTTPTTVPPVGSTAEGVTFTPNDAADYSTVTGTVTVTVSKATPTVSVWPTAGAITTGQALSSSALTGGTASVPGTFTWTAPATVPPSGSTAESVTFTPNDAADYNTVTGTVTVTVNSKTTPTVTVPPTPSAITYGQTLSSSTLNGGTASVAGSFSWTTPTTAPGAGTPTESVTFTPNDTADYNTATVTVTITVNKATPTVSAWPTAGAIATGQALSSSALTGGTASVAGAFAWTTPATVPPSGATAESVTFTPTDAADYNTVTGTVTVTANSKTTPTVTVPPTPSAITYGQTLSSSTLNGGTASVAGSFSWTTPTTAPGAGTPTESVTFTPTDTADYNTATVTVALTVNQATQTISFSVSSPVNYGVAPITLSASGGASGNPVTFAVLSGPGSVSGNTLTILGVGTVTISANQAGNTNYSAATQITQSIVVNPAVLTVSANSATRMYGVANPTFTGTITGAVGGDTFTESYSTLATISSNAGIYAIVPSATGTNLAAYSVTVQNGSLTISQAPTTTSITTTSGSITPGQSVTLTAQVTSSTTGVPTGSVSFYDGTTLLNTATIAGGTATYTTTALSAGTTNQITAQYGGDTNFLTSTTVTSTPITVSQLDFSLAVSGSSSVTVSQGGVATFKLAVNPLYGTYPGPVSLTANGLPAGALIAFSPSTIAANGGNQTVTMTIQTAAVAKETAPSIGRTLGPVALALLLLPLFGARRLRRHGRRLSKFACLLLLLGSAVVGTLMTGCGGAAFKSILQNYSITVTATSGNMQHTAPVTLQIQ